jgi:hypothetical protein
MYGHLSTRSHRCKDLAVASRIRIVVLSSIYVPNLAGQWHRAAIPEARRPQRLPHTDLYAAASALVLRALLRLVEHEMISGQIDSTENSGHRCVSRGRCIS